MKQLWELEREEEKYQRLLEERRFGRLLFLYRLLWLSPIYASAVPLFLFFSKGPPENILPSLVLTMLLEALIFLIVMIPVFEARDHLSDMLRWWGEIVSESSEFSQLKRSAKRRAEEIVFLTKMRDDPEFAAEWRKLEGGN